MTWSGPGPVVSCPSVMKRTATLHPVVDSFLKVSSRRSNVMLYAAWKLVAPLTFILLIAAMSLSLFSFVARTSTNSSFKTVASSENVTTATLSATESVSITVIAASFMRFNRP